MLAAATTVDVKYQPPAFDYSIARMALGQHVTQYMQEKGQHALTESVALKTQKELLYLATCYTPQHDEESYQDHPPREHQCTQAKERLNQSYSRYFNVETIHFGLGTTSTITTSPNPARGSERPPLSCSQQPRAHRTVRVAGYQRKDTPCQTTTSSTY